MPQEKLQFKRRDYERAFALGPNQGFACDTLAELFAFVTGLLGRNGLAAMLRLPKDSEGVLAGPGAWWFRGVVSDRFPLHSALFRQKIADLRYSRPVIDHDDLDRRLRHEYFRQTRTQFHELTTRNVWDLLFEMQHYRLPTRLLDWSLSMVTAAFFAVHYARENGKDFAPSVWILNPRILSGVCLGEYALNDYAYLELYGTPQEIAHWDKITEIQNSTEFGRPNWIYRKLVETPGHYPLNASWTNPRLATQMGAFTLQAGTEPLDVLANRVEPRFLFKVRLELDRGGLDRAWKELQSIGVDSRYVFPEREDLTRSIKEDRNLK